MQLVLSNDLWKKVQAAARRAPSLRAAIAHVTCDVIGFCRDDLLVLEAFPRAIASGETAHVFCAACTGCQEQRKSGGERAASNPGGGHGPGSDLAGSGRRVVAVFNR